MEFRWQQFEPKEKRRECLIDIIKKEEPNFKINSLLDMKTLVDISEIPADYYKLYLRGKSLVRQKYVEVGTDWPSLIHAQKYRVWACSESMVALGVPCVVLREGTMLLWEDSASKLLIFNKPNIKQGLLNFNCGFFRTKLVIKEDGYLTGLNDMPAVVRDFLMKYKFDGNLHAGEETEVNVRELCPSELKNNFLKKHYRILDKGYSTTVLKYTEFGGKELPEGIVISTRGKFMHIRFYNLGREAFEVRGGINEDNRKSVAGLLKRAGLSNGVTKSLIDEYSGRMFRLPKHLLQKSSLGVFPKYIVGKNLGTKIINDIIGFIESINMNLKPEEKEIEAIKTLNQYNSIDIRGNIFNGKLERVYFMISGLHRDYGTVELTTI